MIYPKFIQKKDTIGITAPSDGIKDSMGIKRLEYAIHNLGTYGFSIIETENVRRSEKGRSASALVRAKEMESLFLNREVKAVICASGGDFLLEILPYFSFSIVKENPKWIQGYSDPTGLLYVITTYLDIATLYGNNIKAFAMEPWHLSLKQNIDILQGKKCIQKSFPMYEKGWMTYETGKEGYALNAKGKWMCITGCEKGKIEGRMIGGCLDVLNDLFGTRYDYTLDFIQKYKEDGILFYFDIAEMSNEQVVRTLWKLNDAGWFLNCTGILFGRLIEEKSFYGISLKESILSVLKALEIPILVDVDIGHTSPRMTIINGALASVTFFKGKGEISFQMK